MTKPILTQQELEIMKVVWKLDAPTVRQVYETLRERRQVAYTTVMTMMNILESKGYLNKRQGERAFVYSPSQPEKQVIRSMVREFIARVFDGAAEPLLLHLAEDEQLTAKDLQEIRAAAKAAKTAAKGKQS